MHRKEYGEVLFIERSLPNPPDGKWKYRKKGLFYSPTVIMLSYAFSILYFENVFDDIKMVFPLIIFIIVSAGIFISVINLLFGYDDLIVYESAIQLPEKSLMNIITRTHNIVPYEKFGEITKCSHYPSDYYHVFDLSDKNNGYWTIRKCFIIDIDRLSDSLIQICSTNHIKFVDLGDR